MTHQSTLKRAHSTLCGQSHYTAGKMRQARAGASEGLCGDREGKTREDGAGETE